jgi:hypothetical protein
MKHLYRDALPGRVCTKVDGALPARTETAKQSICVHLLRITGLKRTNFRHMHLPQIARFDDKCARYAFTMFFGTLLGHDSVTSLWHERF